MAARFAPIEDHRRSKNAFVIGRPGRGPHNCPQPSKSSRLLSTLIEAWPPSSMVRTGGRLAQVAIGLFEKIMLNQ